ncbi:hypothetical protein BDY24DRAFT_397743 [Mrakia frigida]|uniref:nucleotidyltransferase domain-containing protein n=1 Tax=Mrakia frigida TaxID=29902 RepID=UPI003FCC1AF4
MLEYISGTPFLTWRSILDRVDPRSTISSRKASSSSDAFILDLYRNSLPLEFTRKDRCLTLERLERCIHSNYGASRFAISLFGSVVYGLDSDSSDSDISLFDAENPDGTRPIVTQGTPYDLRTFADHLRSSGFSIKAVITNANTPIISAKDPSTGIELDINVNHLNGSYNSLFFYHHGRLSPTLLLPLAFFIKTWAIQRGLSSSTLGSARNVTSYALLLLVLTYLVEIKAIENLFQQRSGSGWVDRDLVVQSKKGPPLTWKQRFSTGRGDGLPGEELVPISLLQAVEGFYQYVGRWEPMVSTEMVCLRVGGRTKRTRVTPQATMFVEDPFITSKNATGGVNASTSLLFFQEARRAKDILNRGGSVQGVLGR